MTLIYSTIDRDFAFQVSDRLVTLRGKIPKKFDEFANKSIVLLFPNVMLSISYTGIAFIDGKPTDKFIADLFEAKNDAKSEFIIRTDKVRMIKSLGRTIIGLKNFLEYKFNSLSKTERKEPFELIICGWQLIKNKWKPIAWSLCWNPKTKRFDWNRYVRLLPRRSRYGIASGNSDVLTINKALKELIHEANNGTEESYLKKMVDQIEEVSKIHPHIGPNCMAITISPFRTPQLKIQYFEKEKIKVDPKMYGSINEKSGMIIQIVPKNEMPQKPPEIPRGQMVAYCPYILTPRITIPPSEIVGIQNGSDGLLKWIIIGPDSNNKTFWTLSQNRPKKP